MYFKGPIRYTPKLLQGIMSDKLTVNLKYFC